MLLMLLALMLPSCCCQRVRDVQVCAGMRALTVARLHGRAGLYEVTLGFFSRRKPLVKVHVNGEAVLTVAASPQAVVHHAGGRLQSSGRYTNSNITGLTHVDFIALPGLLPSPPPLAPTPSIHPPRPSPRGCALAPMPLASIRPCPVWMVG